MFLGWQIQSSTSTVKSLRLLQDVEAAIEDCQLWELVMPVNINGVVAPSIVHAIKSGNIDWIKLLLKKGIKKIHKMNWDVINLNF